MVNPLASLGLGLGIGTGYGVISEYARLGILWAKWKGLPYNMKISKIAEAMQSLLDAEKDEVSGLSTKGAVDAIYSFIDKTLDFAWMVDEGIATQMFVQMIQQSIAYAIHSSHAGSIGTIGNVYSGSMYLSPMESTSIGEQTEYADKEMRAFLSAEVGQNIPSLSFNLIRGANRRVDDICRSALRNVDSILDEWNDLALSYYRHYHSMSRERFADAIKMKETATDRAYGLLEQVANEHLARVSEQLDTLEGAKAWFDAGLLTEDELKMIAVRIDLEREASENNYDEYKTDIVGAITSAIAEWDAKITQALGDLTDNENKYNVLLRVMLSTVFNDVADFVSYMVAKCQEAIEDVCAYRNVTKAVGIVPYSPLPTLLWKAGFETADLSEFTDYIDAYPDGYIPTVITSWKHHGTYGCEIKKTPIWDSALYKVIEGYTELYFLGHVRFEQFSDLLGFDMGFMTLGQPWYETCHVGVERDIPLYGDDRPRFYGFYWRSGSYWEQIRTTKVAEIGKTYKVQIACKQHATQGWLKIWIDGELIVNESNIDTSGSWLNGGGVGILHYTGGSGTPQILRVDCFGIDDKFIDADPFT